MLSGKRFESFGFCKETPSRTQICGSNWCNKGVGWSLSDRNTYIVETGQGCIVVFGWWCSALCCDACFSFRCSVDLAHVLHCKSWRLLFMDPAKSSPCVVSWCWETQWDVMSVHGYLMSRLMDGWPCLGAGSVEECLRLYSEAVRNYEWDETWTYIGKEVTDGPMQILCLCHANLRLLTDTVNALTSLAQHEGDACEALIRGLSCMAGEIGDGQ